jgi:hypothetical protein
MYSSCLAEGFNGSTIKAARFEVVPPDDEGKRHPDCPGTENVCSGSIRPA